MENVVQLNQTDDAAGAWNTVFDVGVEAIVGLPGKVELYDLATVTDPIKAAVAAMHPSIDPLTILITFTQTYLEVCHMTIKIKTGNALTIEGSLDQEVWKNLTSVMTNAETAQVFLSSALNCAAADAPADCDPVAFAQRYYEKSQQVPVAEACENPEGCPPPAEPDYYVAAALPAAVLKVPDVLASGTPAPAAGAFTGPLSMAKQLTFVFDLPVEPVVMCFPAIASAAGGGLPGIPFVAGLGATWLFLGGWLIRKCIKAGGCKAMCAACAGKSDDDGEGEEGEEEEEDEDEEDEEAEAEAPPDEGDAKEGEGDEDEGEDGKVKDGEQANESDVNLEEYLNAMFTPGVDDSTEMKVNPVLVYVVEREKKEEKAKADAEREAAGGDGEEEEKKEVKKEAAGEQVEHKTSALKRIGWSLKSEAVVADVAKQLKNIDAHMSKSKGIDVKKEPFKRSTKAGGNTTDVIQALKYQSREFEKSHGDHNKHFSAMGEAAEMARAQLRQMKLKTKVDVEEEVVEEEKAGEEGEEGEEGADAIPI